MTLLKTTLHIHWPGIPRRQSSWNDCTDFARTDFGQFSLQEGVVALKGQIFNSFHLVRVWWS